MKVLTSAAWERVQETIAKLKDAVKLRTELLEEVRIQREQQSKQVQVVFRRKRELDDATLHAIMVQAKGTPTMVAVEEIIGQLEQKVLEEIQPMEVKIEEKRDGLAMLEAWTELRRQIEVWSRKVAAGTKG